MLLINGALAFVGFFMISKMIIKIYLPMAFLTYLILLIFLTSVLTPRAWPGWRIDTLASTLMFPSTKIMHFRVLPQESYSHPMFLCFFGLADIELEFCIFHNFYAINLPPNIPLFNLFKN